MPGMQRKVVRHARLGCPCDSTSDSSPVPRVRPRPVIDIDRFLALLRALNGEGVDYVVIGAVALGLHGLARATEDVDLFVRATPDNVAGLKRALYAVWSDPDIETIEASQLAGEYPVIRYGPPDGSFTLDILSRLGGTVRVR